MPAPGSTCATAFSRTARLFVKFASTESCELNTTTETRSAGVICVARNFTAASCARMMSSVSMDVRSKKNTSMRRSRTSSLIACSVLRLPPSTGITTGFVSSGPAVAMLSMSEYEKLEIFWGLPLSVTVNWSVRRPLIDLPERSVTSTSMRTNSDSAWSTPGFGGFNRCVGNGAVGAATTVGRPRHCCWADCCCAGAGSGARTRFAATKPISKARAKDFPVFLMIRLKN